MNEKKQILNPMKRLALLSIIAGLLLVNNTELMAQNSFVNTQYMFNLFVLNPALAGTNNYYQIKTENRYQWLGLKDSPHSNSLSMYGPVKKYPMGLGSYLTYEVAGFESYLSLNVAYAYHVVVTDEIKISLGLAVGLLQYKVDFSDASFKDDDIKFPEGTGAETVYKPTAKVGAYLYTPYYHVGIAVDNLFNSKVDIGEQQYANDTTSRIRSNYYFHASYKYFINRQWAIEPFMLLKMAKASPMQLDIAVRTIYKNMVWFGAGFRTVESIPIYIGYIYNNKIEIGISYDIGIGGISKYYSGSAELYIGYKFDKIKD
jgi:type IX secretion system PorP/SprF family membrane protein